MLESISEKSNADSIVILFYIHSFLTIKMLLIFEFESSQKNSIAGPKYPKSPSSFLFRSGSCLVT